MAVAAVSANAQWWIGGELGINTTSGSTKNTQTVAGTTQETTIDDDTNVYFGRRGKSPWIAPIPLTKYLSATEHEEGQVIDPMHLCS